jgi:hypothetical protein
MSIRYSGTEQYVADLHERMFAQMEWAKAAPDLKEMHRRTVLYVCPYLAAIERVDSGEPKNGIEADVSIRVKISHIPGVPVIVAPLLGQNSGG